MVPGTKAIAMLVIIIMDTDKLSKTLETQNTNCSLHLRRMEKMHIFSFRYIFLNQNYKERLCNIYFLSTYVNNLSTYLNNT